MDPGNCSAETDNILRLENIELTNISNINISGSGGIYVSQPHCCEVIMEDVTFMRVHGRSARMAAMNTLQRVRLTGNVLVGGGDTALFSFPSNSKTKCTSSTITWSRGSVLHVVNGSLEVVNSTFAFNFDETQAGTIKVDHSNLTISESIFELNYYASGACIRSEWSNMWIDHSNFSSNGVSDKGYIGGCISAHGSQIMEIGFSKFWDNLSIQGGAIAIVSKPDAGNSSIVIFRCAFERNRALFFGGAIVMRHASARMKLSDVQFSENSASAFGSCLASSHGDGIDLEMTNSIFLDNRRIGHKRKDLPLRSAIDFFKSKNINVRVTNNRFERNEGNIIAFCGEGKGLALGYALFLESSVGHFKVRIHSSIFDGGMKNNTGAVSAHGTKPSSVAIRNCAIRNHLNYVGGVILIKAVERVAISASELTGNGKRGALYAQDIGTISIPDCNFTDNSALDGGAINLRSSVMELRDCLLERNFAEERGGAIASLSPSSAISAFRSTFRGNEAKVGGGLYAAHSDAIIASNEMIDNKARLYGGAVAIIIDKPVDLSRRFSFHDMAFKRNNATLGGAVCVSTTNKGLLVNTFFEAFSFEDNYARSAGGAIYTSLWKMTHFNCLKPEENGTSDRICVSMRGNRVGPGGYGEHVATSSVDFIAHLHFKNGPPIEVGSGENHLLPGWKSGDAFPDVEVITIDHFGHERCLTKLPNFGDIDVAKGKPIGYEEVVHATMSSEDRYIINTLTTDVSKGNSTFTVGRPLTTPGEFSMTVSVKEITTKSVKINISVRNCTVNERTDLDGTFCRECDRDHYNFNPEKENCTLCPDNSDCGGKFIIPKEGYWNALPCSPFIDRCISDLACNNNRTKLDVRFPEEACINRGRPVTNFDDTNSISSQDLEALSQNYSRSLCKDGHEGPLCGSCIKNWAHSGSSSCRECQSPVVAGSAVAGDFVIVLLITMLEISATRKSGILSFKLLTRSKMIRPRSYRSLRNIAGLVEGTSVDNSREMEVTVSKFQEVIKMVAIGRDLGVSWSAPIIQLFNSWDIIGSVNSMLGSYGWDCLLPHDGSTPRAVVREIIKFLTPLVMLIIISIYFLVTMSRSSDERKIGRRLCLLTTIILMNNSYESLVQSTFNAFYCVPVHENVKNPIAVQDYWAVSTSVLCKSDSHWMVLGIVGIPGVVFSVMFPIVVIASLVYLRNKGTLDSDWAKETMGIFIGGYEDSFVYWDAIVLLRKAMLSAVMAFSYNLGGNLQGLLAICILVFFLVVHMKLNPYKDVLGQLNNLESTSLSTIVFTLLTGVILNDDRMTYDGTRWILIVMVLGGNICFFAYLVILMVRLKVDLMKFELDTEGIGYGEGRFLDVVKAWVGQYLKSFRLRRSSWERVPSFEYDQEDVQISNVSRDESQSPVDIQGEIQAANDDNQGEVQAANDDNQGEVQAANDDDRP